MNSDIDYEQVAKALWMRIWERCVIEGCRYTTIPLELDPTQKIEDKCIWCNEPREGQPLPNGISGPKGILHTVVDK